MDDLVKKREALNHLFIDPSQDWHNVSEVESDNEIFIRLSHGFSDYLNNNKNIICVTHAGVVKALLYSILKIDPKRTNAFKVRNGCILSLQTEGNLENIQLVEMRQI